MAGETADVIGMDTATHTPIAELTPTLDAPATRCIKVIVTLKWPYSSATGSIAFLLSEPDFRLRRSRGQVRVQFAGSSAKSVAKAGIASGDEISLCLDGAEWLQAQESVGTPGRGIDFELKFTERVHLQFKPADGSELTTIDIDHPAPTLETTPVFARIPTPEPLPSLPTTNGTSTRPADIPLAKNEWSSPAFVKRVRTSYGSLFEENYDPLSEADGSILGKGRKKTRLSSSWRYVSRSPTPEPVEEPMQEDAPESIANNPPVMMDETCQTDDLETEIAADTLASFARQNTNIGSASYPQLLNESRPAEDILPTGIEEVVEDVAMAPPEIHTPVPDLQMHTPETQTPASDIQMHAPEIQRQSPELNSNPATEFLRKAPSLPRLHPIPSDSLPLVSPLISHNYGFSFGRPLPVAQETITEDQPAVPESNDTGGEEEEDLYGASPIRRRSNVIAHDFNGFQEPAGGGESAAFPAIGEPVAMEHQHGQWQSINGQNSHSASPLKDHDRVYEEPQNGRSYDEEQNRFIDDMQTSHGHMSQYPEAIHELTGTVRYPDLDEGDETYEGRYEDESREIATPPLRAPAMSRSQSAQSPVVDFTEDSDEENEQESKGTAATRESEFEGFSEEEEEEQEAEALRKYGLPDEIHAGRHIQRAYEASDNDTDPDAEGEDDPVDEYGNPIYEDAEEDVQHPHYGQLYDEEEEGSLEEDSNNEDEMEDDEDDGEEEGEDEEEEDQAPRGDPIVIDLLSSDDEEAGEPSAPVVSMPQASRSQSKPSLAESAEESDGYDEELGTGDENDDENNMPYNERQEVRTRLQRDPAPLQTHREDDAMYEADGDDEGPESASDGDEIHDPQLAQRAVSLSSGYGDEDQENEDSASDEGAREQDSHDVAMEDDKPQIPNNEARLRTVKDVIPERPGSAEMLGKEEQITGRSPISANTFALDGASDERLPKTVSYPDLPNETSPPASDDDEFRPSAQFDPSVQTLNTQLPTPGTSQLVGKIITAESSFTSTVLETTVESTTSIENRSISRLESSNEVLVTEVTTHVSSVQLHLSHSDEEHQIHVPDQGVIRDDILENDDVLMSEAVEIPEVVDRAMRQESIEPSMIEDGDKINQPAEDSESGEVDQLSEISSDTSGQLQENLSQREDSPMDDAGEADEDATAVGSDESDDNETSGVHSFKRGVTTRSAAHALAKAGAGNDEPPAQEDVDSQGAQEQQKNNEEIVEEPEFTVEHPRRSHRRVKSTASAAKVGDNSRPVTPVKPYTTQKHDQRASEQRSPVVVIDNSHSAPKGHDASFELALSSLESPSKPPHDLRQPPVADLKMRLSRALRTELSEFTALKVLRYHMNQKLDILAIATTTPPEPQRAKGGPRHYQITFNITDPSIAPSGVTEVQIFRPYSHALPTISAGDGILLRDFQVSSVQKGFALRSLQEEGSSWAVFKADDEPEIRGPPVEFGDTEKNHVLAMKTWFAGLDDEAKAKVSRANESKAAVRR